MMGNTCNYKCSFCSIDYHSGTKRWKDLGFYINTCNRLIQEAGDTKISFRFTGGEPTLYPELQELLKWIKGTGNYTTIISNGSRTLRWWEELRQDNSLDLLYLTYHPEQTTDYQHIIDVINLFRFTDTMVLLGITSLPQHFDRVMEAFEAVKSNCYATINIMQINDSRGMQKYTPEQKQILLKNFYISIPDPLHKKPSKPLLVGDMKMVYSDGTETVDNVNSFVRNDLNRFIGWDCYAGSNYIRIEYDKVQRAVCGIGSTWSLNEDRLFRTDAVKCTFNNCGCALDMMQPKILPDKNESS